MNQICIRIPPLPPDAPIELDVTIGGKTHLMHYRVEGVDCADASETERIERLRSFIDGYDRRWELVQIGTPRGTLVPVMFRQRQVAANVS